MHRGARPFGLALLLLTACQQQPDFDERYEQAATRIDALATQMQDDFANQAALSHDVSNDVTPEATGPSADK